METGEISIQVAESDLEALQSGDWEREQSYRTSEPITIKGLLAGEEKGRLNTSLVVRREVDMESGFFTEVSRTINLGNISVPKATRIGIAGQMEGELVRVGKRHGVSEIVGKVTKEDAEASPWLLDFYRNRNYKVTEKGFGWEIKKTLI